jgi:hypothetical protein
VLAVAQDSTGQRSEAMHTLERILELRPGDVSALQALAGYLQASGDVNRASELRARLEALVR